MISFAVICCISLMDTFYELGFKPGSNPLTYYLFTFYFIFGSDRGSVRIEPRWLTLTIQFFLRLPKAPFYLRSTPLLASCKVLPR